MTIASTITLAVDYDGKFHILLLTLSFIYDEATQKGQKYNRLYKNNFFCKDHEKLCGQVDATVGSKME